MNPAPVSIIVTRAAPGADETIQRLAARGLSSVRAPMLSLSMRPDTPLPASTAISGYVFTSANGVRAVTTRPHNCALPAWCVGPATANAARKAGFARVEESRGNAKDLAAFIMAHSRPGDAPLLHVANADAVGDLKAALERSGYEVIFAPLYAMRPATALPEPVEMMVRQDTGGVILIHSAKGAAAFANLARDLSLERWHVVAISQKATIPFSSTPLASLRWAPHPDEDSLIATLDITIATLSA